MSKRERERERWKKKIDEERDVVIIDLVDLEGLGNHHHLQNQSAIIIDITTSIVEAPIVISTAW